MSTPRILLIDDDARGAESMERLLKKEGYAVVTCHRGDDGLARAQEGKFDLVLTDLRMPGLDGLELVRQLHGLKPRLPIVLMTAYGTAETAIEATKSGAFDYLIKPFEMEQMVEVVARGVTTARLMSGPVELGASEASGEAIIGKSRAMQEVYKAIGRVTATSASVLLLGETGTGKEMVARALYEHGDRAAQPFIAVNCAAIPETLLESELFGHEKGAFTGAETRRIGRFEQAHGGTLFLDEIGDMSLLTQVKLLRVLQDKTITRLGGKENIAADVRIIAATHQDLEAAIRDKKFRDDLYYRLAAVIVRLPPLRDRREDIPDLVRYFLRRHGETLGGEFAGGTIHADALAWLQEQPWPGNVRQLSNVVREVLLLARGFTIGVDHCRGVLRKPAATALPSGQTLAAMVGEWVQAAKEGRATDVYARLHEAVDRLLFARAIELAEGNQAKAARWLNVSRPTMRDKLNQFGLRASADDEARPAE